jgi:predicted DNA-binding protein
MTMLGHARDKTLRVKVSEEELQVLSQLAKRHGRNLSQHIRELIRAEAGTAGVVVD